MDSIIKTKLIKVGNSYGIRIPKVLLEQVGLSADVELSVQGDTLVLRSAHSPRQDWETQFKMMAERGEDTLLDPEPASLTKWDNEDWEW